MGDAAATNVEATPALNEFRRQSYYRRRFSEHVVDVLGLRPETIFWSLSPEYEGHEWDSRIQFPGQEPKPCKDPLVALLDAWADGWPFIAVESATGTQKTATIAAGSFAYLDTRRPGLIKTFAPSANSLERGIWKYANKVADGKWSDRERTIHDYHPNLHISRDLHIYMDEEQGDREDWSMEGMAVQAYAGGQSSGTAKSSAAAQGLHAENMTLIVEEATGVHPNIVNALFMTSTDANNQLIMIGNPDNQNDGLHTFWKMPDVVRIRISGLDAPNYVTGRTIVGGGFSQEGYNRMLNNRFKGNKDHPLFISRTRGICPETSGECLFQPRSLQKISRAHRKRPPQQGEEWDDVEWQDPLLHVEHSPRKWEKAVLSMARTGNWGAAPGEDLYNEDVRLRNAKADMLNVMGIQGWTRIFSPPEFGEVGAYVLALDVAGDRGAEQSDWHTAIIGHVTEQTTLAMVRMKGPRQAYALAAMALALMYGVPITRDLQREAELGYRSDAIQKEGRYVEGSGWRGVERVTQKEAASTLYYEAEDKVTGQLVKNVGSLDVRDQSKAQRFFDSKMSYPVWAHETNGVGALHLVPIVAAYPQLFHNQNMDRENASRSSLIGWRTTKGQNGTRSDMIDALDEWGKMCYHQPYMVASEELYHEMKTFRRNENTGKFEAEASCHDDAVMAKSIQLCVAKQQPRPVPARKPSSGRSAMPRMPKTKKGSDKAGFGSSGLGARSSPFSSPSTTGFGR